MSGNYHLDVPLVALPGRGVDLGVRLSYNAQLWSSVDGGLAFNADGDWPAPGWQIGFGKLSFPDLLIEADGTRRPLVVTSSAAAADGVIRRGVFGDGSLARFECRRCETAQAVIEVTYPGRAVVEYRPSARWNRVDQVFYPVQITDANGNYLSIQYLRDAAGKPLAPRIDTITDSVGRVVRFHYDNGKRLVAISRPALAGGRQTVVRLFYETRQYYLPEGQSRVPQTYEALTTVFFPGNRSAYVLVNYTDYGMPRELREYRAVQVSTPSLAEQGVVAAAGQLNRVTAFNYRNIRRLKEIPTYSRQTATWYDNGVQAGQTVTQYVNSTGNGMRRIVVTHPDGTRTEQVAKDGTRAFDNGLVYRVERRAANGAPLSTMTIEWEPGIGGRPRQRAVTAFNDEARGSVRHEFTYGTNDRQVLEDRLIDSSDGLVMRTVTRYLDDPAYTALNLVNLPLSVQVFEGQNAQPSSRREFVYDESPLQDVRPASGHLARFRESRYRRCSRYQIERDGFGHPQRQCVAWQTGVDPAPRLRGNLTTLRVYANAATAIVSRYRYDVTGNLVQAQPQIGAASTFRFDAATDYSQPAQVALGGPAPADTMSERYTYDRDTGLLTSYTNRSGHLNTYEYVPGALGERLRRLILQNGAQLQLTYDDDALTLRRELFERSGATPMVTTTRTDGGGQLRETTSTVQAGVERTVYDYDAIGRLEYQSLPYVGGSPLRIRYRYDAAGRLTETIHPDGSLVRQTHNPARVPDGVQASDIGPSVLMEDAWGRQLWHKYDRLGRLAIVVQPNPSGTGSVYEPGSLMVRYRYDALGRLAGLRQGAQLRAFSYDALGRLVCQAVPERDRTRMPNGATAPGRRGSCSDVWQYDDHTGNVTHIDSRGVHAIAEKGNDPLGRLRAVRYDLSHVDDPSSPVAPAADVRYEYRRSGNVLLPERIVTSGFATEWFGYDADGGLEGYALTLDAHPRASLALNYRHDALGRLTQLRYPARVPLLRRAARLQVDYGYHPTGELSTVSLDGAALAFDLRYGAGTQLSAMKLNTSAGVLEERYGINDLGDIVDQQLIGVGGASLLNLGFGYERRTLPGLLNPTAVVPGRTGQLVTIEDRLDASHTRGFEYDALGRLQRASRGIQTAALGSYEWLEYGYDAYGNRSSVRAYASGPRTRCRFGLCAPPVPQELPPAARDGLGDLAFDPASNRLSGAAYDAAGNLTRVDRGDGYQQHYTYDAAGRLVKVTDSDGGLIEEYRYASDRRRIGFSRDFNRWTYTLWDGAKPVSRYAATGGGLTWEGDDIYAGASLLQAITPSAGGAPTRTYVHRAPGLLAVSIDGPSGLGHQVEWLNPYGFTTKPAGDWLTSRMFDDYQRGPVSRVDAAANRNYDSRHGRFNETDPLGNLGLNPADPQSLNLYAYGHNDPVNRRDPLGLMDDTKPPRCDQVTYGGCAGSDGEFCWKDEGGAVSCTGETVVVTGEPAPLTPPAPVGFDSWYSTASGWIKDKGRDLAKKAACQVQKAVRFAVTPVAETVKTLHSAGVTLPSLPIAVGDRLSTAGAVCFGGCTLAGYASIARHVSLSNGQDTLAISYGVAIPAYSIPDNGNNNWDKAAGIAMGGGMYPAVSVTSNRLRPGTSVVHDTWIAGANGIGGEYADRYLAGKSMAVGGSWAGAGFAAIPTQTTVIPMPQLDCE